MQELFYRLTEEDVQSRFFQKLTSLTDSAAQHLCSVSYEEEMAFAAVVGPREEERIVAASCYYLDPATGLADVAYLVDPEWQGSGLGTILHERTVEYARGHGVRGFTADVLLSNAAMLRVFQRGDHELTSSVSGGNYEVTMIFRPA
jgi:RimJ/RimL family protein N-acetyltransferase